MKQVAAVEALAAGGIPKAAPIAAESAMERGACPACGSGVSEKVLESLPSTEHRSLISCSRCGLLRFTGEALAALPERFEDRIHFQHSGSVSPLPLVSWLQRWALGSKLRFVRRALDTPQSEGFVVDLDGADGTASRLLEREDALALNLTPSFQLAAQSLHRHGVHAVVADSARPPIRMPLFDVVCRLRRFSSEADPAGWTEGARALLRPGGRLVLQIYDSASWAFLITGSHWAGLCAGNAAYAYRGADLEVLLDYCGLRITRKSHFFPLLNAAIWVSSLFPNLEPHRNPGDRTRRTFWKCTGRDILYCALVALALPLGIVESVCHSGSVLMAEAELK